MLHTAGGVRLDLRIQAHIHKIHKTRLDPFAQVSQNLKSFSCRGETLSHHNMSKVSSSHFSPVSIEADMVAALMDSCVEPRQIKFHKALVKRPSKDRCDRC